MVLVLYIYIYIYILYGQELDDEVERFKGVYGWGQSFVKYAITNSRNKNLITCSCRKCDLNRSLHLEEVYDHLIGGSGIFA
jgi:hypothetical protein